MNYRLALTISHACFPIHSSTNTGANYSVINLLGPTSKIGHYKTGLSDE